jgi:predicted nucleic acid-binding protein
MEISYGRHLLDTSALVKLLLHPDLKEPGSDELHAFWKNNTSFHTLDLCVGEALNVLKQKAFSKAQRKVLSFPDGYLVCVNRLIVYTKPQQSIRLIQKDWASRGLDFGRIEVVKNYKIDWVDLLVIEEARSHSGDLLITADRRMAKAARDFGIAVWDCAQEKSPPKP